MCKWTARSVRRFAVVVERGGLAGRAPRGRLVARCVVAWVVNFSCMPDLLHAGHHHGAAPWRRALRPRTRWAASRRPARSRGGAALARVGLPGERCGRRRMLLMALVVVAVACALYVRRGSLPC
ncbi:hypothetical protein QJS66_14130 [Kocuria rhizophila]|nr:hypothetical protein QJS66_14130 [Kocuria rhizophila]